MSRFDFTSCNPFCNLSLTTTYMGSRFSKTLRRPHVIGAVTGQAATTPSGRHQQLHISDSENDTSQMSTSTCTHNFLSQTAQDSAVMAVEEIDGSLDAPLDSDSTCEESPDSRAASLLNALRELPAPVYSGIKLVKEEPPKSCLICCEKIPNDQVAIEPCHCKNYYCVSCLKNMFLTACKDISRMPPRCCGIIPIHYVRPYLSEEELARFRAKFEERNTRNPFYCPVQRCSAFIPNRLLPQRKSNKGKQRVDSAVGTPQSPTVACPQCEAHICTECRNLAHSGSPCEPFKYGLDETTAKLLKSWGYKRCPACGEGVKRMFGCDHMACRCGAHFCWTCLGRPGDCAHDEDYDYDDDDDESVASTENSPGEENGTDEDGPITKPLNLDGGGASHWQYSNLDFGEEPSNGDILHTAMCEHFDFTEYAIDPKESLLGTSLTPTNKFECMRCWREIHPVVQNLPEKFYDTTIVPAGAPVSLRKDQHATWRPHNRARDTRPFKRELSGYAASVPDLTAPPVDQLPSSIPPQETSMDWLPSPSRYVVDTYGNIITADEPPRKRRRYSVHDPSDLDMQRRQTTTPHSPSSSYQEEGSHPPFSLAYSCDYCSTIVCSTCQAELHAEREERNKEEAEAETMGTRQHWGLENQYTGASRGREEETMMAAEQMVRLREGDGAALGP